MAPKTKAVAKKPKNAKNYVIAPGGLMRYSRSTQYRRKALYKFTKKTKRVEKKKPTAAEKFTVKKIGGTKNGGERKVPLKREPRSLDTQVARHRKKSHSQKFSQHKRYLRKSITPGTVLIMLSGRHKGKRVVFLKQLASGLLLVSGPFKLNGCPLRRVSQRFVIATKTKLDVSSVSIPEHVNDEYFRRTCLNKPQHGTGDIFASEKEEYKVTEQRKTDQKAVDEQILKAIRATKVKGEKCLMFAYLGAMFSLRNKESPHKIIF